MHHELSTMYLYRLPPPPLQKFSHLLCRFEFEEPSPTDMHSPSLSGPPSSLHTSSHQTVATRAHKFNASRSIEPPPFPMQSQRTNSTQSKINAPLPAHSHNVMQVHTIGNIGSNIIKSSKSSSKSSISSSMMHGDRQSIVIAPQPQLAESSKRHHDKAADAEARPLTASSNTMPVATSSSSATSSNRAFTERLAAKVQEVQHRTTTICI
jgi:hypothetical protein